MSACINCDHDNVDHDDNGCRRGRHSNMPCTCPFDGRDTAREEFGIRAYEDARPVANPDRVKAADAQVGGDHYRRTPVQPWDVIDAWDLGFYAGNILKYLYRAGRKGDAVEDLKKARHYLDKLIEKTEEGV